LNALENAIVAPLVEEPLKLLPLAFVLYLIPVKKLKSVILLGIASGLGFQIIEDISYILTDLSEDLAYTLSRILERVTSAIASHWTFSGLAILGIYLLYRAYRGQKAMIKPGFSNWAWLLEHTFYLIPQLSSWKQRYHLLFLL